jgi:hypothetical protein
MSNRSTYLLRRLAAICRTHAQWNTTQCALPNVLAASWMPMPSVVRLCNYLWRKFTRQRLFVQSLILGLIGGDGGMSGLFKWRMRSTWKWKKKATNISAEWLEMFLFLVSFIRHQRSHFLIYWHFLTLFSMRSFCLQQSKRLPYLNASGFEYQTFRVYLKRSINIEFRIFCETLDLPWLRIWTLNARRFEAYSL